jgi:hypothetical protein
MSENNGRMLKIPGGRQRTAAATGQAASGDGGKHLAPASAGEAAAAARLMGWTRHQSLRSGIGQLIGRAGLLIGAEAGLYYTRTYIDITIVNTERAAAADLRQQDLAKGGALTRLFSYQISEVEVV